LSTKRPELNQIAPPWVRSKQRIRVPARLLTAEAEERIGLALLWPVTDHLALPHAVA
jgi:hypothetical protein